jgi:hypothetical protein
MRKLRQTLRGERGDITFFTCIFVVSTVMLISFLLLYASVQINCINIRNGAKLEINNLIAEIYADTFRSQREVNYGTYMRTLTSDAAYIRRLESSVGTGLAEKVPLSTEDYRISNIRLSFSQTGDRIEYVFTCSAEFYISMFGNRYPTIRQQIRLTGHHNVKF